MSFEVLKKNTLNKNIQIINKAVSNKEGILSFTLGGGGTHSRDSFGEQDKKIYLECTPLTQYIEGKKDILMKIDTEGHDIIIIKTILPYLQHIHTLIFEFTIYWYDNKDEAIEVLDTLRNNYKYMYLVSRRGLPYLEQILPAHDLKSIMNEFLLHTYQTDILCTNFEFQ